MGGALPAGPNWRTNWAGLRDAIQRHILFSTSSTQEGKLPHKQHKRPAPTHRTHHARVASLRTSRPCLAGLDTRGAGGGRGGVGGRLRQCSFLSLRNSTRAHALASLVRRRCRRTCWRSWRTRPRSSTLAGAAARRRSAAASPTWPRCAPSPLVPWPRWSPREPRRRSVISTAVPRRLPLAGQLLRQPRAGRPRPGRRAAHEGLPRLLPVRSYARA